MVLPIVMAGGEGVRLRPLTVTRPKPMLPVVNRPILWHVLSLLRRNGYKRAKVTLHYLAESIEEYFKYRSPGVELEYSVEERALGTAGGIKLLEDSIGETFLVVSGDLITDYDLRGLVEFHRKSGALATMALSRVKNPTEYGIVITDEDGRITRFLEKPGWSEVFSDLVNAGIYVMEPEVLRYIPRGRQFDFSKDLFPLLLEKGEPIYGFPMSGFWRDVGLPHHYLNVQFELLDGKAKLEIPGRFRDGIWFGEGVEVDPDAELIPPCVIDDYVKIGAGSKIGPYAIIGRDTIIGSEVVVERSVVYEKAYLDTNSRATGCIIGSEVLMKSRARVLEGSVIGDGCHLGVGSEVSMGVKVWPGKVIEAGSILKENLIRGIAWRKSLFSRMGIVGLANVELVPETTAKLGASFSTILRKKGKIATGRDAHRSSRMLKRSFIGGSLSAGADVYDLKVSPLPMLRRAVRELKRDGGAYFTLNGNNMRIVLVDEKGFDIDERREKELEASFFRDVIRRVDSEEVGDIYYPARPFDGYLNALLELSDAELLRKARPRVVVDYAGGTTSLVAPKLLSSLGFRVIAVEGGESLSEVVRGTSSLAGFSLSGCGELLRIVDDEGYGLTGDEALAVMIEAMLNLEGGDVAVTATASTVLDELVESHGYSVERVKLKPRYLMEACEGRCGFGGNEAGGYIVSKAHPFPDAILSMVKLTEYLVKSGERIGRIRRRVYRPKTAKDKLRVPMEERGFIVKQLLIELGEERMETVEGLKFRSGSGWVLILPVPNEPYFELIAEAEDVSEARRMIREFKSRISGLLSNPP